MINFFILKAAIVMCFSLFFFIGIFFFLFSLLFFKLLTFDFLFRNIFMLYVFFSFLSILFWLFFKDVFLADINFCLEFYKWLEQFGFEYQLKDLVTFETFFFSILLAFKLSYYLYNYLYKLNKNLPIVFTGGSLLFICKGVINIIDINKIKNYIAIFLYSNNTDLLYSLDINHNKNMCILEYVNNLFTIISSGHLILIQLLFNLCFLLILKYWESNNYIQFNFILNLTPFTNLNKLIHSMVINFFNRVLSRYYLLTFIIIFFLILYGHYLNDSINYTIFIIEKFKLFGL